MQSWEEIYKENFNIVYYFLLKLTGNSNIAEDITADTFLKAMESLDSYRGESSLKVWLCTIAKHQYFNYYKKEKRLDYDYNFESELSKENVEKEVLEVLGLEEIYKNIDSLKSPYDKVLRFRLIDEFSFKTIGEIFGKNENWACVVFHRGRKMLKEKMEVMK